MSDHRSTALADLRDEARFVCKRDVPIFDEHVERNKKGKVVRKFDRSDLERIARNCNRRDSIGQFAPLTLGHTDPDQPDETKQPRPVGYAAGYRVKWHPGLGRHVLVTDYYIRRDDYRSLDRPTSIRRQAASRPEPQGQPVYARAVGSDTDLEFLDIPAFLRKQAD